VAQVSGGLFALIPPQLAGKRALAIIRQHGRRC